MILALIVCHLSVLVVANPFHKYPYVFLLDVGNEEIQKTNSEQIRLSIPGGSVALRYPAIGNGDTIGHIRVSGIDFGTDLKANIVDGGPGYKYVVLVFMGNPGVAYDAVVTVQTVNDSPDIPYNENVPYAGGNPQSDNGGDPYHVENDANNSAEDLSDDSQESNAQSVSNIERSNAELMQSSSNLYVQSDVVDESYDADEDDDIPNTKYDSSNNDMDFEEQETGEIGNEDETNNESDEAEEKDIHVQYKQDFDQEDDPSIKVKSVDDDDDDDDDDDLTEEEYKFGFSQSSLDYNSGYKEPISVVNNNLYSKYPALNPHLNFGGIVYSQGELQKSSRPVYQEDPLDYEEPDSLGQSNDNDDDKFQDSNNNNYVDTDDGYAVEY